MGLRTGRTVGKNDSLFGRVEPFGVLLALLTVWLVAGAWLCLESAVGISVCLAYDLVGIIVMVLMRRGAFKGPLQEIGKRDVSVSCPPEMRIEVEPFVEPALLCS